MSYDQEKFHETESKVQRDLKDLIERHNSIFTTSTNLENESVGNPLQDFLIDETNLIRKLLNNIRMDTEKNDINNSKTPKHWKAGWQLGPAEVLPFVNGLISRYQVIESLNTQTMLSCKIDLSQLTRPRTFLAALKQYTARQTKHPLEVLRLHADWSMSQLNEKKEVAVLIDGLLISGGLIDDGVLKDLDANAAPVTVAPTCQIAFLPEENIAVGSEVIVRSVLEKNQQEFNIPVYANAKREGLICSLPVKCEKQMLDIWKRRGVMLHLNAI